jgi:hypothetical protein
MKLTIIVSVLILCVASTKWTTRTNADHDRQAWVETQNLEPDQQFYFTSHGTTLVIMPGDNIGRGPAEREGIVDTFTHGDVAQTLIAHGFESVTLGDVEEPIR